MALQRCRTIRKPHARVNVDSPYTVVGPGNTESINQKSSKVNITITHSMREYSARLVIMHESGTAADRPTIDLGGSSGCDARDVQLRRTGLFGMAQARGRLLAPSPRVVRCWSEYASAVKHDRGLDPTTKGYPWRS